MQDMQLHPDKFVRLGPFWQRSKKNQKLQKLIVHANGSCFEPGGREQRFIDNNPRFNYKVANLEGETKLSTEE